MKKSAKILEFLLGVFIVLIYPYIKSFILMMRLHFNVFICIIVAVLFLMILTIYNHICVKKDLYGSDMKVALIKSTACFFVGVILSVIALYILSLLHRPGYYFNVLSCPIPFTNFEWKWLFSSFKLIILGEFILVIGNVTCFKLLKLKEQESNRTIGKH